MKKVGILTWHYYGNCGSALQAYALQQVLKKECMCDVQIVNYRNPKFGQYDIIYYSKKIVKNSLNMLLNVTGDKNNRFNDVYEAFRKKFLIQTKVVQTEKRLKNMAKQFDVLFCGSDQIWAPNVFNPIYMLNFAPDSVMKVSYAASIGLNDIPKKLRSDYAELLQSFKSVSVREQAGADLLASKCGIEAEVVLDPTLLVDVEHWKIIETKKSQTEGNYVFCYFLNADHQYKDLVSDYAKEHNLKIVGYSANQNDYAWMNSSIDKMGPCEFLWLIHHARVVVTDSYHGTIFSLLYHREFVTFERFQNTDAICQNSRIYQLDSYFDISNRIVVASDCDCLEIAEFNYEDFECKLQKLRYKSIEFLHAALEV